jgi:hypothetical protein
MTTIMRPIASLMFLECLSLRITIEYRSEDGQFPVARIHDTDSLSSSGTGVNDELRS